MQTALEATRINALDRWVREFLLSPDARNPKLLEVIESRNGFFVGPVILPLRLCRPYPFDLDDAKISAIARLAPDDLDALPPILLRYRTDEARLDITDGHHRYRAFRHLGRETCHGLIELGTEHITD